MNLSMFWGKTVPFQSLITHCALTGMVAQQIFDHVLSQAGRDFLCAIYQQSEDATCAQIGFLASLHDMGKLHPSMQYREELPVFAQKLQEEQLWNAEVHGSHASTFRHEQYVKIILNIFQEQGVLPKRTSSLYANVLGNHHQGKSTEKLPLEEPYITRWLAYQIEFCEKMRMYFLGGIKIPTHLSVENARKDTFQFLALGIVVMADWIASGKSFADAEGWFSLDKPAVANEKIQHFLSTAGLTTESVACGTTFTDCWCNIPQDSMRPLQQVIEKVFQNNLKPIDIILIEAPMGEGKTEAALYAALQMAKKQQKNGFYIGLPTSATANQMVSRVRDWSAMHNLQNSVSLLHGTAWLTDDSAAEEEIHTEDEREALGWLSSLRRGMLSQYAVGTVDQAMMSVLRVKYGVLRLLGLWGKVLILDEVHAFDAYMGRIIYDLLVWCKVLGIPVVLLSATLTESQKKELFAPYTNQSVPQSYPAITTVDVQGEVQQYAGFATVKKQQFAIKHKLILHQPAEIAKQALEAVENGGCLCILLNTVKQAQAVFREIQAQQPQMDCMLFHAQFPAARRAELEQECIRKFGKDKTDRPKQAILVATQVVEQSLDVDFDHLFTAIAPMDLLLQRMGRVHRHSDTLRPNHFQQAGMTVLLPTQKGEYEADAAIYGDYLLLQSERLVTDLTKIAVPEDLAPLVEQGYNLACAPAGVQSIYEEYIEYEMKKAAESSHAMPYVLGKPRGSYARLFEKGVFEDNSDMFCAQTRLAEPSRRIALLEEVLYQKLASQMFAGARPNRKLARVVMENSLSIREKRLHNFVADNQILEGRGLLGGVLCYPAERGIYTAPDGKIIQFDPLYGLQIKEDGNAL